MAIRTRAARVERHVLAALRADAREGLAEGAALFLLSHVVRGVIGLAAGALVARALGPGQLGAYAVTAAAVAIGASVADFGLANSTTRQIGIDLVESPERAFRSAAAYARLRLLSGLVVLAVALVLAGPLAALLALPEHEGPWLVRLAGIGVLAASASGIISTIHYSLRRFRPLVIGQVCASLTMLGVLAALFAFDRLSLAAAVAVGIAGNMASLGVMLALLPPQWRSALRRAGGTRGEESRRILVFAAWLGVAGVFAALTSQLDLILVNRLLDPRTAGLYALALALAFKADVINQILHGTLLPAVSGLSSREAFANYCQRSLVRSAVLAVPLLVVLPLAGPFISAVYGSEYESATPILYALMVIVIFDLFTNSLLLLAFPMNLPRRIAASHALAAVTLALMGTALIAVFGVYGAVGAKLLARVGAALVIGWAIAFQLGARRQGARITFRPPDPAGTP
jgi:O-antigen/teichoic acid export membrane protein